MGIIRFGRFKYIYNKMTLSHAFFKMPADNEKGVRVMRSDNLYNKRKFLTVCSIVCHEIWLDSTYLNFQTGLCT